MGSVGKGGKTTRTKYHRRANPTNAGAPRRHRLRRCRRKRKGSTARRNESRVRFWQTMPQSGGDNSSRRDELLRRGQRRFDSDARGGQTHHKSSGASSKKSVCFCQQIQGYALFGIHAPSARAVDHRRKTRDVVDKRVVYGHRRNAAQTGQTSTFGQQRHDGYSSEFYGVV